MPKKKEENNFFVGIKDPVEVRRSVLEASKKLIETLQRFEQFKENRKKKIEYIESLKKVIADIGKLNTKLKNILPKTNLRIPSELLKEKDVGPVIVEKAEKTGLGELDKELKDIEEKLNHLEN